MSGRDDDATAAAGERLRDSTGRQFWRGLDELADTPGFRERLAREFPALASLGGDWQRRDLLKCLGGTIALAGLDGCKREPDEEALPYIVQPEGTPPGESRYYATAVELDGVGQPVVGKTRDGRPIKLEGNPDHPASGGATDAFTQAALLGLYDPERSTGPLHGGDAATWDGFAGMALAQSARLDATGGAGFRLLTGPVGSPTMLRQIAALLDRWPEARWHVHAPLAGRLGAAARAAFGRVLDRRLRLDRAHAIVSLDDDLLGPGPNQVWHGRAWSIRRRAYHEGDGSALLFAAEPTPTPTGVTATDRLPASHARIAALLVGLAGALGVGRTDAPRLTSRERAWVAAAADALAAHRGRGLLAVGTHHAPELQRLGFAINERLGNVGSTLLFIPPPVPTERAGDLAALVRAMEAGEVDSLAIVDSNPAYTAPADIGFAAAMARVPRSIHAGLHVDETAELCDWHVPLAQELESWSDVRAADGSAAIVQPLVRPFLDVRGRHGVLAMLTGALESDREIVQATWAERWDGEAEERWARALVEGQVETAPVDPIPPGTAAPPAEMSAPVPDGLELVIRADPSIHDGQFATNAWLQELPKPLTKITWDNAVHIALALAARLGLDNGDMVRLSAGGRSVEGPVWILPGQARDTIVVHLGYGRATGGRLATGLGFDAYALRTAERPWMLPGATIEPVGAEHELATTQTHFAMHGHDFVRFVDAPDEPLPPPPPTPSFYPPQPEDKPAWGMAIDLDLCIGCNACVTACVAENNIPMVGKEQVAKGREMHWLRVDRYYEGPVDDPRHAFQPVPCMHCENAPCEMGCPVNATVHSPDGLNLQVYNRCIGTRTCSAYCPYKVRRFNWLDYVRDDPPSVQAARNPEVTVRDRGVMEKCTYCIQRIAEARIAADIDGRPIAEGEVRTACQQACPTQAIVFGDVSDPDTEVSRRKRGGRDYSLLEEANTRPRTTYGARIESGKDVT